MRHSGRKRKSTVIQINGHAVLAKNNYVLKGGSYDMGAFNADARKAPRKKSVAKKQSGAAPRTQKPSEIARLQHNEHVKADAMEKQSFRRDFISRHGTILKPFMDEPTRRMLDSWRASKLMKSYQRDELFIQPALITGGEMRDYQLAGLNFMVDMHRQNLGMILGDEMGLVSHIKTSKMRACYYLATWPISNNELNTLHKLVTLHRVKHCRQFPFFVI